jgi:F420H(2)-dependent quinone reductase
MAQVPSIGLVLVNAQKAVTGLHRRLLESPAAPLVRRFGTVEFLVLRTTGRRSGQPRRTPLSFTRDGDAFVVIASDGGAPRNPDWFANLQGHPEAVIEVGGRPLDVRAEVVTGAERERLWRSAVRSYPLYAQYQRRTDREIPVVRLGPR